MNIKDITLLSVTFNQHIYTHTMLMSLHKQFLHPPEIIIIDNSTTNPIDTITKKHFTVIDNTNQHITGNYHQCSKNHCSTIEYALYNLIKTKWCLLVDNDILFKPSVYNFINSLDDTTFDALGEIGWDDAPPNRLFPYFCLINVQLLKKHHIHYFDTNRCIGPHSKIDGVCGKNTTRWYKDTGCSFLEDITKARWNIKQIKLANYIVHKKNTGIGLNSSIVAFLANNHNLFQQSV